MLHTSFGPKRAYPLHASCCWSWTKWSALRKWYWPLPPAQNKTTQTNSLPLIHLRTHVGKCRAPGEQPPNEHRVEDESHQLAGDLACSWVGMNALACYILLWHPALMMNSQAAYLPWSGGNTTGSGPVPQSSCHNSWPGLTVTPATCPTISTHKLQLKLGRQRPSRVFFSGTICHRRSSENSGLPQNRGSGHFSHPFLFLAALQPQCHYREDYAGSPSAAGLGTTTSPSGTERQGWDEPFRRQY